LKGLLCALGRRKRRMSTSPPPPLPPHSTQVAPCQVVHPNQNSAHQASTQSPHPVSHLKCRFGCG
jgi:hypothetical protein